MAAERVAAWVERLVSSAATNPGRTLVAVGIVTVALGAGLPGLTTHVDMLDVLPPDDPNTQAARALQERFQSAYSQQVNVNFIPDESRCRSDSDRLLLFRPSEADCASAKDEVYVRATDEFARFVEEDPDSRFTVTLGAHAIYRLLNWTAEGGEEGLPTPAPDEAFAMPGRGPDGAFRYNTADFVVHEQVPEFVRPFFGNDDSAIVVVLIPTQGEAVSHQEVGRDAARLVAEYVAAVEAGQTTWTVFGADNPPTFYVELAVGSAHAADLVEDDLRLLLPLTIGFILAALYVGFRNGRAMLAAGLVLVVSGIWVFGGMGWLGAPITAFNLAAVPILLGVGIDMAIHLITAFQAARAGGTDDATAFRRAARGAGFAMLLATVTTVAGLVVLAFSPTPLIVQMAWVSAVAVASVFLLSMTLLPAIVAVGGGGASMGRAFRPSGGMRALGRSVASRPGPWVGVLVVVVGLGAAATTQLHSEPFGEFAFQFPPDDPLRVQHVENLQRFYDTAPGEALFISNVLVMQGDMVDPAMHDWIRAIADNLATKDHVRTQTLYHLPLLVENYATVKDGIPGAVAVLAQDELLPYVGMERDRPDSREEILEVLEAGRTGPMRTFGEMFVDYPNYGLSIITFSTATGDMEAIGRSWDDVWAAVDEAEELRPAGASVGFVGNTPTNQIFVEQQLPWVAYLAVASFIAVALLVWAATRSSRDTAIVAVVVGGSTLIWTGVLVALGIGLSIYLVVPIVFISAIGSDYAIHMVWAFRHEGSLDRVYEVVGKAVFFGMVTDAGAFLIFSFAQNQAVKQTMFAAALAVLVTFAVAAVAVAAGARWAADGQEKLDTATTG